MKMAICSPKIKASVETNPANTLILDFELQNHEKKYSLFNPLNMWYFVMTVIISKYRYQEKSTRENVTWDKTQRKPGVSFQWFTYTVYSCHLTKAYL
jgi:vacuolar-type H+-ATPase catalytic subunit A/Vma1